MSTTETAPDWQDCPAGPRNAVPGVLALPPKQVALGTSPEALTVRRTLPQLTRSFVGAWCFVDHYGPGTAGMDVPPHPHTSLQTVSWLFSGEIEHRDSSGAHALVRPGEVNLMTGGAGIAHSEVSTPATTLLHGVQLWVVLPQVDAGIARDFQHHRPDVIEEEGLRARVFLGALGGDASPVVTRTPLLGAEVVLAPGKVWEVEVDPGFEHGVLVDAGVVRFDGTPLDNAVLGVRDAGLGHLRLENPTDAPARVLLLGGTPFDEGIVMWWNFIGRSHDEVAALAAEWNADGERFGRVEGYAGPIDRLLAPPLPDLRLRPRFRRGHEA